ncbi:MAG: HAD-IB family phosphatase [Anaerolineales bacterium]|nr:HAD-IB family phosphatase [Anaerolineales bacterium]
MFPSPHPPASAQPAGPRADWAPFDLVIFDCDSTLTDVEGIDELARWQGRDAEVAALTNQAMNGEVPLEAVYSRRLDLLQPTREEMRQLGRLYRDHLLPGAAEVVAALLAAERQVFIVSGGLAEAVRDLGQHLGLPSENVYAVGTDYDELSGRWWETWSYRYRRGNPQARYAGHDGGPLTIGSGKLEIVKRLRAQHRGRAMLIGDGTSDLEARAGVELFVGFGGVVSREKVMAGAEVYIRTASLAPILPLVLARPALPPPAAERPTLAAAYAEGVSRLRSGEVVFASAAARAALLRRITPAGE